MSAMEHSLSAEPTHSRWSRALPPRLAIKAGDTVHFECLDSSGAQVRPTSTVADYLKIDRSKIHALTGPVEIEPRTLVPRVIRHDNRYDPILHDHPPGERA